MNNDEEWVIRRYEPESDDFKLIQFYDDQTEFDVYVAELGNEIMGYVGYGEINDHGILDMIEVKPKFRGVRNEEGSVATNLARHAFERVEEDFENVMLQAKALKGPVQYLAEQEGYEISGFQIENNATSSEEYASEGFTAELWKLDDSITPLQIESYLSSEVHSASEASLPNQLELIYLQPQEHKLFELSCEGEPNKGMGAVRFEVDREGSGNNSWAISKLDELESRDTRSWAYTAEFDITEPYAHEISRNLADNNWSLVNISPNLNNPEITATATMAKLNKNAGSYNLTQRTRDFVEATTLPFRVDKEGELSDNITFNPEDDRILVDEENASAEEIERIYKEIS